MSVTIALSIKLTVRVLRTPVSNPSSDQEIIANPVDRGNAVCILSRVASGPRLFHLADGRFFAYAPVGERVEIYGLKLDGFRDWLINGYLVDQPEPPSDWAIRRVVDMLEARARFKTSVPPVFIRVGRDGDDQGSTYFLDLGSAGGQAVKISAQGWIMVNWPDVHFRRPAGHPALPMPSNDRSTDLLRSYANLTDDWLQPKEWLGRALRARLTSARASPARV
jgi:hypothetical protein